MKTSAILVASVSLVATLGACSPASEEASGVSGSEVRTAAPTELLGAWAVDNTVDDGLVLRPNGSYFREVPGFIINGVLAGMGGRPPVIREIGTYSFDTTKKTLTLKAEGSRQAKLFKYVPKAGAILNGVLAPGSRTDTRPTLTLTEVSPSRGRTQPQTVVFYRVESYCSTDNDCKAQLQDTTWHDVGPGAAFCIAATAMCDRARPGRPGGFVQPAK